MRAAVLAEPGRIEIQTVPVPQPGVGEVRVKLSGCGVCASNLSPWKGEPWFSYPMEPGQLGHEGWGVVDSLGDGASDFEIGQRVAMLSNHAYAEFDVAPQNSVVALPPELSAADFPGEPLACALNIWQRTKSFGGLREGATVAIVGIGFLGAILTRLAANDGAQVLAVSRRPFSLEVAKQMGARHTIPLGERWQVVDAVKSIVGDGLCDVVIEAVGKQEALDVSSALCRERGRLVIAGYHQDGLRTVNLQEWNWRGLDVINAHEREHQKYLDGIARAARAVASGELEPSNLYTHRYSLDQLGEALDATRDRPDGFLKALIEF